MNLMKSIKQKAASCYGAHRSNFWPIWPPPRFFWLLNHGRYVHNAAPLTTLCPGPSDTIQARPAARSNRSKRLAAAEKRPDYC